MTDLLINVSPAKSKICRMMRLTKYFSRANFMMLLRTDIITKNIKNVSEESEFRLLQEKKSS